LIQSLEQLRDGVNIRLGDPNDRSIPLLSWRTEPVVANDHGNGAGRERFIDPDRRMTEPARTEDESRASKEVGVDPTTTGAEPLRRIHDRGWMTQPDHRITQRMRQCAPEGEKEVSVDGVITIAWQANGTKVRSA
jgi:hypothetical protein